MKNIRIFYLKIFLSLVVKFSIYLNRRVFVMFYYFLLVYVSIIIRKGSIRCLEGVVFRYFGLYF